MGSLSEEGCEDVILYELTYLCYQANRDRGMPHEGLVKTLELTEDIAKAFNNKYEEDSHVQ